jgi:WD40 repeat protein
MSKNVLRSINGLAHTMAVRTVRFSPDSAVLLTGSDDKRIHAYDVYVYLTYTSPFSATSRYLKMIITCNNDVIGNMVM